MLSYLLCKSSNGGNLNEIILEHFPHCPSFEGGRIQLMFQSRATLWPSANNKSGRVIFFQQAADTPTHTRAPDKTEKYPGTYKSRFVPKHGPTVDNEKVGRSRSVADVKSLSSPFQSSAVSQGNSRTFQKWNRITYSYLI